MKDIQGRSYLTKEQALPGTEIETDGDFTCIGKGEKRTLLSIDGGVAFQCSEGQHDLEGQRSDDGTHYVGIYPVDPEATAP